MKVYLVRHGESIDDVEDCYGGIADFELTDSGTKTAKVMAEKLKDSGINILYSSPYKRASQTADIIAETLGCEVTTVSDLRERNSYGVLSGVNKEKAKDIFGHILSNLKGKAGDYYAGEAIPGDESINEFDKRVKSAFECCIKDLTSHNTIGIVTHGNVTRSLYRNVLNISGKVDLDLLALTVINCSPEGVTIERNEGVTIK